jgi:hypothetical protein
VSYADNLGIRTGIGRFGIASLGSDKDYYATCYDLDGNGVGILHHVVRAHREHRDAMTALSNRRGKGLQIFDLNEAANLQTLTRAVSSASAAASMNPTPFGNRPISGSTVPILDASHVQRGCRIDVRSSTTGRASQSLCLRSVSMPALPDWSRMEDAAVVTGLSSGPQLPNVQYKSTQLLFRWTDWSLVVPSPRPKTASTTDNNPIKVHIPPHSLPRLRYGVTYLFRARGADIAGNGCTAEQASSLEQEEAWRKVTYLRHDLVPPPALARIPDKKQKSGMVDPGTTIILRSGRDAIDEQTRVVVAPASNFETARISGVLDNLSTAGNQAVGEACSGKKHFIDPATNGIVVSIGWCATSSSSPAPTTLEYKPKGSQELQKLLVEENKNISITFKKGKTLAIKVDKLKHGIDVQVPAGRVIEVWLRSLISSRRFSQLDLHSVPQLEYQKYGLQYSRLAAPVRLSVVHATEKPLLAPAFDTFDRDGPVLIQRRFGESAVSLAANNVPIDNESTGKVELGADWEEVLDDVAHDGSWPKRSKKSANLATTSVVLSSGHPWGGSADYSGFVNVTGVHDFGDTKARKIKAKLLGISRFTQYFPPDTGVGGQQDPLRFSLQSSGVEVAIPASAPPPPPQVVYMVPTIAHSRLSGHPGEDKRETDVWGLRIYLRRNWFASGDKEDLAVILRSSDGDPNGVSQIGTDPARDGDVVTNEFRAEHFRDGVHVRDILRPKSTANTSGSPRDPDDHLEIMAFPVSFEKTKNLLYSDIAFRPRSCYRPFFRLALARYQPDALDRAHLSSTVTSDFIQVGPYRTLSLVREGQKLSIAVVGPGTDQTTSANFRNSIVAVTEFKDSRGEPWREAKRVILSQRGTPDTADIVWTGDLPRTQGRFNRIVVEEFELTGSNAPLSAIDLELDGRLVFSDRFEYS